jgi:hypothetical protein
MRRIRPCSYHEYIALSYAECIASIFARLLVNRQKYSINGKINVSLLDKRGAHARRVFDEGLV